MHPGVCIGETHKYAMVCPLKIGVLPLDGGGDFHYTIFIPICRPARR